MDIYLTANDSEIKNIVDVLMEPWDHLVKKRRKKYRDCLRMIFLNLMVACMANQAVQIYRRSNFYSRPTRYGKLFFSYRTMIAIMDELADREYINMKIGYYYDIGKKVNSKKTRIWATEKLFSLAKKSPTMLEIHKEPKDEPIILNNKSNHHKELIDYEDDDYTNIIRQHIQEYNQFIKDQDIIFELSGNSAIDLRTLRLYQIYILKGIIQIETLEFINHQPNGEVTNRNTIEYHNKESITPILFKISEINRNKIESINKEHPMDLYQSYRYPETHMIFNQYISTITDNKSEDTNSEEDKEKKYLKEYGIHRIVIRLKYEFLHRVFNNGSFEQGGRFYGALHIGMNKKYRDHIFINNSYTCELDYSALHIRMLYHMEGKDYRDDPYRAICESGEERTMFKLLQLIGINAPDDKKAIQAIRDTFRRKGFEMDLKDCSILKLLDRFKEYHQPIAHYLNTGIGLKLQNIDSRITDSILMDMIHENIPILPVHDSYIVPEQYKDKLEETMVKSYDKMMGFEPVIG